MCDGYLRVSRKISGLNRKRKENDKILLRRWLLWVILALLRACLVPLGDVRDFYWRWKFPENSPWATAPALTDRG